MLKLLVQNVFSQSILERPKKTRKNFLNSWLQEQSVRELFSLLKKGHLVETGMISEKWLMTQINYPQKNPKAFRQLWAILVLEIWMRLYFSRFPLRLAAPLFQRKKFFNFRRHNEKRSAQHP